MTFPTHKTPEGLRFWQDDENVPSRILVQRATNRFQAHERLDGDWLSVGFTLTPGDCRRFLNGQPCELYAALGNATVMRWRHPDATASQQPY